MSRRVPAIAVAVLLACAALGRAAAADHRLVTMVQLHSETQIAGTPSAVWTYITSGKNFATWCPEWRTTKNSKMNITRVGDVLEYIDAWGNGGRSVVTYAVQTRAHSSHESAVSPKRPERFALYTHEPQWCMTW